MADKIQSGLKTSDFTFELPQELIAQEPCDKRGKDRLLVLDRVSGEYSDKDIDDFVDQIDADSILVVNNSKVRKARTYAISETGGKVEFLFLEELNKLEWNCMVTKSKKQRVGKKYTFNDDLQAEIVESLSDSTKVVKFNKEISEEWFLKNGHVPLPPYIKRDDSFSDETRYQTIYAKNEGSVAAPTAGLHFTDEIIEKIKAKGVEIVEITLHVGMGTFMPVRSENLDDHDMHFERYSISEEVAKIINDAKINNRKIVATGTTSVRTLESAVDDNGLLKSGMGRTNLFIKPGYEFKIVDQLLTNFHTPESTLLVLVSAFAKKENIMRAYNHAIDEKYRFFSYGDAMFIK
ncbi:MAG: tRNA preQ1(34) S-adenosylmethionine ribosyltransferase-isomerase QueA [Pleomorphochaeta sp.]